MSLVGPLFIPGHEIQIDSQVANAAPISPTKRQRGNWKIIRQCQNNRQNERGSKLKRDHFQNKIKRTILATRTNHRVCCGQNSVRSQISDGEREEDAN